MKHKSIFCLLCLALLLVPSLGSRASIVPAASQSPGLEYLLEDFNIPGQPTNHFSGNWGELNSDWISLTTDPLIFVGSWGASLRLDYSLAPGAFTGLWMSLWGQIAKRTQALDFNDIFGEFNAPRAISNRSASGCAEAAFPAALTNSR